MSSTERDVRLLDLVEAFSEMGPAWARWAQASVPDDSVSYARLRVLTTLECHTDGLTMTQLATALNVTGRRVTVLVDALVEDGLVERYAHPTDRRSTVVEITEAGRAQQRLAGKQHQGSVAVAFADLSDEDQEHLLRISHQLTEAFRRHLAARGASAEPTSGADPEAVVMRNGRPVRAARAPAK